METTDRIAKGDYSVRINLKGPEEFQQLNNSFNHMAQDLGSVEMLRSDFVNNFSHEFKTPIVSIRGFARMIRDKAELSPAEKNEYLDIIISESERLAELATNVLLLSKIEQQNILTEVRTFNVSEQIRRVISLLDSKWSEKALTVSLDGPEVFLSGNEELLGQVWINLLDNAMKFSPAGGDIAIEIRQTEGCHVFNFSNQGETLTPAAVSRIFDKFYQLDSSHSETGNGLGLSIAREIAVLHGGTITATGLATGGSRFTVRLPHDPTAS